MGNIDELYINVPSLFRCPISLDVMNSPVSLCTGVTYDRTSIQRWLDDGHNTCPATMQVLQTKDFVPNYTLQRLIKIWSNSHRHQLLNLSSDHPPPPSIPPSQCSSFSISFISDLIKELVEKEKEKCQNDESVLFESFAKILCFASQRDDNRRLLGSNEEFVGYLTRLVCSFREGLGRVNPDLLETGLKILQLIISFNDNDNDNDKRRLKLISSCDLVCLLTRVFKVGRPGSRVAAAGIIETFAQDPKWSKSVFERQELVFELLHVLKEGKCKMSASLLDDREIRMDVIRAVLSCLISLSSTRTSKKQLIHVGGVKIIGEMMISASSPYNRNVNDNHIVINELLLTLLEMLAELTEGRAAINHEQYLVQMITNKLMKVSKAVNEHGVSLLWSLCYLYRDKRAKDAVMRSNGLAKILLLMQSDCSPAAKKMCCDLLRIFRVNSKSCLSSYDTKTTHIMPC